jgi:ubiquinone/menaquinone biosynthesis C-methylase UbiE
MKRRRSTSWQHVAKQYHHIVDREGHYYHQHVIIPKTLRLLSLQPNSSLLDLACGQGVLARAIPKSVEYWGVDNAPTLIKTAQSIDKSPQHHYLVSDVTRPLPIGKKDFTHATIILALQNIESPQFALQQASAHLRATGILLIVLNHPCFRIPRQSSWGIDEQNKLQYRRINRYLSPLKIPINQNPSRHEKSQITWSFHFPLSSYTEFIQKSGFCIEKIEEWASDKKSEGTASRMENRGREEFPLFMAIMARKK